MTCIKKKISLLLSIVLIAVNVNIPAYGVEDNNTYYINTSAGEGGSITSSFQVKSGESAVIKVEASEGYEVSGFTINDSPAELSGMEYRIDEVSRNYNISVEFRKKAFNVELIYGEGGSITGNKTVVYGQDSAYTFEADAGYELDKVYIDNVLTDITENTYVLENVRETHSIRAEFKRTDCTINILSAQNGIFQVFCEGKEVHSGDVLEYGSIVTLTNNPDNYYKFACYMINGEQFMGSDFRVRGRMDITAVFTEKTYNITSRTEGAGTILTDDKIQISAGETVLISAVPDVGYTVKQMLINGVDVTANLNEKFEYETKDTWSGLDIAVTFEKLKYNIKTGCGENGTISVSRIADYGSDIIVSFRADEGYEVDKVYVDGELVESEGNDYVFENITEDHEVFVEFKDRYCSVDVVTGENGTSTESGVVPYDGEYTIEIFPDEGYQIDEILLNGTPVYATAGKYQLKNVIDDCIVEIRFEPNEISIPVIKKVTSEGVSELFIEWNTVDKAEGYEIYRMAEGGYEYELIADVPSAYFGQSYTDKGTVCGKEYYYIIRGYKMRHNEKLYGEFSEEKSGISRPGKVSVTSVDVIGTDSLKVKWKRLPGVSGYEIYYSREKDGSYSKLPDVKANKIYTKKLTKLKKGTRYYFKIRAYGIYDGEKVYGSFSSVKSACTAYLSEPKSVKAKMKGFDYASITWKKVSGADGYAIYWSASKNGKYEKLAYVKGVNKLEYKDKFYFTGRNYYKVRAYKVVNKKKVFSCMSGSSGVNAVIKN